MQALGASCRPDANGALEAPVISRFTAGYRGAHRTQKQQCRRDTPLSGPNFGERCAALYLTYVISGVAGRDQTPYTPCRLQR